MPPHRRSSSHRIFLAAATLALLLFLGVAATATALSNAQLSVDAGDPNDARLGHPDGDTLTVTYDEDSIDETETETCVFTGNVSGSSEVLVDESCNGGSHQVTVNEADYGEEEIATYDLEVEVYQGTQDAKTESITDTDTNYGIDTLETRIETPSASQGGKSLDFHGAVEFFADPHAASYWVKDTTTDVVLSTTLRDETLQSTPSPWFRNGTMGVDSENPHNDTPSNVDHALTCTSISNNPTNCDYTITPPANGEVNATVVYAQDTFRQNRTPENDGSFPVIAVGTDTDDPDISQFPLQTAPGDRTTISGETWVRHKIWVNVTASDNGISGLKTSRWLKNGTTLLEKRNVVGTPSPFVKSIDTTNGNWESNVAYTVKAKVADKARNGVQTGSGTQPSDADFSVDNRAPGITMTSAAEAGPDQPTLRWEVVDRGTGVDLGTVGLEREDAPGSGTFETVPSTDFTVEGGPGETVWVNHTPSSSLDEGDRDYRLSADDNITNAGQDTTTVTVDYVGPDFLTLNATLEDGSNFDDATSPLSHPRDGVNWVTGDDTGAPLITYEAEIVDNSTGDIGPAFFTEEGGRTFQTSTGAGDPLRWLKSDRTLPTADEVGPFDLNASAEDGLGNLKESREDPDVADLRIGLDTLAPRATVTRSQVEFNGSQPDIEFDVVDAGAGVDLSHFGALNLSRRDPGSSGFQTVDNRTENISSSPPTVRVTHSPASELEAGTYVFAIERKDNLTIAANTSRWVDLVDVDILGDHSLAQRDGLDVRIEGNLANLTTARFRFLDPGTGDPVAQANGTGDTWVETETLPTSGTSHVVDVYENPPDVPLGSYELEVQLGHVDGAGNTIVLAQDDPVDVTPKLQLRGEPKRFDDTVNATIWASYQGIDGAGGPSCQTKTRPTGPNTSFCGVSKVVIEGLFETSDGGDEWRRLTEPNLTIPESSNNAQSNEFFEYEWEKTLAKPGDFLNQLRIEANATRGSDPDQQHETRVVEIVGGPDARLITAVEPAKDAVNGTGDIGYEVDVTLPATLDESDAAVNFTVKSRDGSTLFYESSGLAPEMEPQGDTPKDGHWFRNLSDIPDSAIHDANVNDDDTLPSGQYTVTYRILNTSKTGDDRILQTRKVPFAVETGKPDVNHLTPPWNEDDEGTLWIGENASLHLEVDAGNARIGSLDDVSVKYKISEDTLVEPDVTWDVDSIEDAEPDGKAPFVYELTGHAIAPAGVGHGTNLIFSVGAESNVQGPDPNDGNLGFDNTTVRLDKKAPDVEAHRTFVDPPGVFTHNESLTDADPSLKINASDPGVGFQGSADSGNIRGEPGVVEVTFFRKAGNATDPVFEPWTGSGFGQPGEDPTVFRMNRSETGVWILNRTTNVLPPEDKPTDQLFDAIQSTPLRQYAVNVTARDVGGNEGNLTLLPIAADLGEPQIETADVEVSNDSLASFTTADINVSWGRADEFGGDAGHLLVRADITEDSSIERANLTLKAPDGSLRLFNASSHANVSGSTYTWNVSGDALDPVGPYRVAVSATDVVGNVGSTRNATDGTPFVRNFTVEDTIAPDVRDTFFDPSAIGPESNARARVQAFDDGAVENASVVWVNNLNSSDRRGPFEVGPDSCKRTDTTNDDPRVRVCTHTSDDAGIDLSVGDEWRVEWRVFDAVNRSTRVDSDPFEVVEEGAPFVERISPDPQTEFVSADGQVTYRIEEPNLLDPPENSITVRKGPDQANLTESSDWTLNDGLGPNGTVHFLNVTTSSDLEAGSNLIIEVNVTDQTDQFTQKQDEFTVDNDDPTLSVSFDPQTDVDGTTWVSTSTEFDLSASDDTSSVAVQEYQVGDGSFQTYSQPFSLPSDVSGSVDVTFRVEDGAGNVNQATETVTVDGGAPVVTDVQPGRTVSVRVTDNSGGVGLDESSVQLFYRAGGSGDFASTGMSNTGGDTWEGSIPSNVQGQINFFVQAQDLVGNTGRAGTPDNPRTLGTANAKPNLTVTAPQPGATLQGETTFEWSASDPDGDTVELGFTLTPVDGSSAPQQLRSGVSNTGSTTVDVSGVDSGNYTLSVRATDGEKVRVQTLRVSVLNEDVVQRMEVPDESTTAGEEIRLEVQVRHPFKRVTGVTGVVERDGEVVDRVPMEKAQGNGSTYVLTYTPEEPGDYRVSVEVSYEDAPSDTFEVTDFTASAREAAGIAAQLVALVLLGAAVVGAGGYGAFGRWEA